MPSERALTYNKSEKTIIAVLVREDHHKTQYGWEISLNKRRRY